MGNTYLITGASSDIGIALIKRLYKEGDTFIVQGSQSMAGLAPLCKEYKNAIKTYSVDLTDIDKVQTFIKTVSDNHATPTHIIHLPALKVKNVKFKKFDEEYFNLDMNVQLNSAIKICKEFLPKMAKNKYGRVLFMLTSYIIGMPPKNTSAYITVKSALEGLAKSLAADYAPFGITVNCIMPSMIQTKFLSETSDLIVQAAAEAHPMKRNATVDDVVPAMAFLLSDEAAYITGVSLPITGGRATL